MDNQDGIMARFGQKYNQNFDPTMVGLSLLSTANNSDRSGNLGMALLSGRQARLEQAKAMAEEAAAKRQEKITLADKGLEETPEGAFRKGRSVEIKTPATGGIYSISSGGDLAVPTVEALQEPQQKTEQLKAWEPYRDPVNGQQGAINVYTGEFRPYGAAGTSGAGGGGGGASAAAGSKGERQAQQAARESALGAQEIRGLIADPSRMGEQAGQINRAQNWANELVGSNSREVRDKVLLRAAQGNQVLEKISALAPATETDVKTIQNFTMPAQGAGQAVWVDWWNRRAVTLRDSLSRNAPELLEDPEVAQYITPIPIDSKGQVQQAGNTTQSGVSWRRK